MRLLQWSAAGVLTALAASAPLRAQDTLRVLRHTPGDSAAPSSVITVTFDRPVAAALDKTIPASRVVRIAPGVAGAAVWRDPITIRFIPSVPLPPGRRFTVTIDTVVRGADGSALAAPYRFDFRVGGARLMARSFDLYTTALHDTLAPDGHMSLLYSAPVNVERFRAAARLELAGCAGARTIPLRLLRQRPLSASDPATFHSAGGYPRDTVAQRFYTVVELEPDERPPLACGGRAVIPTTDDDSVYGRVEKYTVATAPVFRLKELRCIVNRYCNANELTLMFASPVRRTDVVRYVQLDARPPVIAGNATVSSSWTFDVPLSPRTTYTVTVDSAIRDLYGRALEGPSTITARVDDRASQLMNALGIITVPASGPRTMPLHYVNVRSVRVIAYRVPDSARTSTMSAVMAVPDPAKWLRGFGAETTIVALPGRLNLDTTVEIPLPAIAFERDHPLVAMRVELHERLPEAIVPDSSRRHNTNVLVWPESHRAWWGNYSLLQVTQLAVTARLVGLGDGSAYVSDLANGRPRANVTVSEFDQWGRLVARGVSRSDGIARLTRLAPDTSEAPRTTISPTPAPRFTTLDARADDDRVIVSLGSGRMIGYEPGSPLDPSVLGARRDASPLVAGALFVDRALLRPGETVHLKGVVRRGMLGALELPRADSARLVVHKQPDSWPDLGATALRDTVFRLSKYGTLVDSIRLRPGLPLGMYDASLEVVTSTGWRRIRSAEFRLGEYRAPDFYLDMTSDTALHFPGDTVVVPVVGKYHFGAPMRGAVVRWKASMVDYGAPWLAALDRGWTLGSWTPWSRQPNAERLQLNGVDTLDGEGRAFIRVPVSSALRFPTGLVDVEAALIDASQQMVTSNAWSSVSASHLFVVARAKADVPAWRVGEPTTVEVRTIDERGRRAQGVSLRATLIREHWEPQDPITGAAAGSVIDTLRTELLDPSKDTTTFTFTPATPGTYVVDLTAIDATGALTRTAVSGSVSLPTKPVAERRGYRLSLVADKPMFAVGDSARVHFDSPFKDAEAWITVEREGILEQRRQRATRGDNVFGLRIAERHIPNVFVSVVLVARDETTRPDTTTERLTVGYLELMVNSSPKALTVRVQTNRDSYAPGDTSIIRIHVQDASHRGIRSEVALWGVDQAVLALGGAWNVDPFSQMYQPRGVGAELWSTLQAMLTNDPALVTTFLRRSDVQLNALMALGSTAANAAIVIGTSATRTKFASSAFYLGSVETDGNGNATAHTPLPDNLTRFRVMAVAVSAGDRIGSGDTTLLVTRPLAARPVLPRFVRPSDSLVAGVAVSTQDGRAREGVAEATATGLVLRGPARMSISLSPTTSAEARFVLQAPARDVIADSVAVQLGAGDGTFSDATRIWLPVRPDYHPRTHAVLGAVRDSQDVALTLPPDVDPRRSRMRLRVGTSPLSAMLAAYRWLRAYRFDCTEQLTSVGRAMVAVWQATKHERTDALGGDPHGKLQELVDEISRRQRSDGAFRYWPTFEWSTPWLSAYAGLFLLDARELGVTVDSGVIVRARRYLSKVSASPIDTGGMNRYEQRERRLELGARVAAVEFLRRAGPPDSSAELRLLGVARSMTWEDRLRLAEVLAPRADIRPALEDIVDAAWRTVTVAGHRVDLPDSSHAPRAFPSRVAPAARLLSASLVLRPTHDLLSALTETVLQQGRAESAFAWSTQDYSSVVMALARVATLDAGDRVVHARAGKTTFVARRPSSGVDTSISAPLTDLLETASSGQRVLRVHVDATAGDRPVYYALEVDEVPLAAPVKPDIHGIVVERWYERFDNGQPVTRVDEGDLVRVRLRVTVPADREFVAVEDPLPAGLEVIDSQLRTSASLDAFATQESEAAQRAGDAGRDGSIWQAWLFGSWDRDERRWTPWEHRELHDDRVSYFARMLWTGSYTASYIARATTAGSFVAPPAYAEEMYNPALQGRTAGTRFLVDRTP